MTIKSFKPALWKSMKIVSKPTTTSGQIRKDDQGRHWEWCAVIQNIRAKLVSKPSKPLIEVFRDDNKND